MLQRILTGINGFRTTAKEKDDEEAKEPSPDVKAPRTGTGDYRIDALNRLLESEHFRASERNKRFLKFVVEETVAGRARRIKAFTVAIDVFGRDSDFDASVDPIVRIAAGHLRRSLDDYYSVHGRKDPVRICLPLGTYVPSFTRRESLPRRAIGRLIAERKYSAQSGAVGGLMALLAAGAALGYLSLDLAGRTMPQRPVVVVDNARVHAKNPAGDTLAHLFTQFLWIALSGEESVRIIGARPDEDFANLLAHTRANFGAAVPLYQLLSTVRVDGDEFQVYWHVIDGRSNETYLSSSAVEELAAGTDDMAALSIARKVAASLRRLTTSVAGQAQARPEEPFSQAPHGGGAERD